MIKKKKIKLIVFLLIYIKIIFITCYICNSFATTTTTTIEFDSNNGTAGEIAITNVGLDEFNIDNLSSCCWSYDIRNPILSADAEHNSDSCYLSTIQSEKTKLNNIYAPNIIYKDGVYHIYFGGWNGTTTPNDNIYLTLTTDFISFFGRKQIINHSKMHHVNNPSVVNVDDEWYMLYTAYSDNINNQTSYATSNDGVNWLSSSGSFDNLVNTHNYRVGSDTDINGSNVLYYEDGIFHMFFTDFKQFNGVKHAISTDFKNWHYKNNVSDNIIVANDLKKIRDKYLMVSHLNTSAVFYSVSDNLNSFPDSQILFGSYGGDDKYITSIGLVTNGKRLYGALYGAGSDINLTQNRIFARWLQYKIIFTDIDGNIYGDEQLASGRDTAIIEIDKDKMIGRFSVYNCDDNTIIYHGPEIEIHSGDTFKLNKKSL